MEGEGVVAVPECDLVRPGAERHLQLLKPAPAPHRACGLRPHRRHEQLHAHQHREDEGPAGEVGIDRVTLES